MLEFLTDNCKTLAVAVGLIVGFPLVWKRRDHVGYDHLWQIALLCVSYSVICVLGATVFCGIERVLSGEAFRLGGVSTYGMYFFAPIPYLIAFKGPRRAGMTDLLALYAVPSLFLQRVCCLIAGCCQGNLIPGTEMRWPTRELELVFYVLLFVYFLRKEKSETFIKGSLFPILMASYGAFRFLEEGFRDASGASFVHLAHLWSILALIVGISILVEMKRNYVKNSVKKTGNNGGKYSG